MDATTPISQVMSTDLKTVQADDQLLAVQAIMDDYKVHHVPVCEEDNLVGIISQVDMHFFLKGIHANSYQQMLNTMRLKNYKAHEIMTKEVVHLEAGDSIQEALNIFKENKFRAIPILQGKELVGMLTTHDIISYLLEVFKEKI